MSDNLTPEKRWEQLKALIAPVAKWLQENANPHHRIIISIDRFDEVADIVGGPIKPAPRPTFEEAREACRRTRFQAAHEDADTLRRYFEGEREGE